MMSFPGPGVLPHLRKCFLLTGSPSGTFPCCPEGQCPPPWKSAHQFHFVPGVSFSKDTFPDHPQPRRFVQRRLFQWLTSDHIHSQETLYCCKHNNDALIGFRNPHPSPLRYRAVTAHVILRTEFPAAGYNGRIPSHSPPSESGPRYHMRHCSLSGPAPSCLRLHRSGFHHPVQEHKMFPHPVSSAPVSEQADFHAPHRKGHNSHPDGNPPVHFAPDPQYKCGPSVPP